MSRITFADDHFLKRRFQANLENWLLTVPEANPAMIEIFRQREKENPPHLVQWYGEFPGKYLTGLALHYDLCGDDRLREAGDKLAAQLADVQAADGYLGPFPYSERFIPSGEGEDRYFTWDVWGHYHCILGLLCWYRAAGNAGAKETAIKAADYVLSYFGFGGRSILEAGWTEMNLSVGHVFALLYQETGKQAYLDFVLHVAACWEAPEAGNYFREALAGVEFYQMRKPRWESLHGVQTLGELYKITGDHAYLQAFSHIWHSILKTDRHNTGGFSAGEQAQGTPYHTGAIETCCTVAWMVLTEDLLALKGGSHMADELELSFYNGILSAQNPTGRWVTYNTPMAGVKKASAHEIVFQAIPGSPELNCCSVNWPRGLGLVEKWAVMRREDQVLLHYYGGCTIESRTPGGQPLQIVQETAYPLEGEIKLRLHMEKPETFALLLRIPAWSRESALTVKGEPRHRPVPGSYAVLQESWQDGDEIILTLDMSLHFWAGEEQLAGCASIYRGPLLLAYDQRWNDTAAPPSLSIENLAYTSVSAPVSYNPPLLLLRFAAADGRPVYLCDFISAGVNGTGYDTWLPMEDMAGKLEPLPFSVEKPVWCSRIEK